MIKILITGCGGHYIGDTIKAFRDCGHETKIYGAASEPDPFVSELLDGYFKVKRSLEPGYIDQLIEICKNNEIDILVPNVDEEISLIAARRQEFGRTKLSIANDMAVNTATDKLALYDFLSKNGIPCLKYSSFSTYEEFEREAKALGFPKRPVCIKVRCRAGSNGFRIINDNLDYYDLFCNSKPTARYASSGELKRWLQDKHDDERIIIQEYVKSREYSVDLLADNGQTLVISGRENVCENSIPMESVLKVEVDAFTIARAIVRKLNFDGNVGIDFLFKGGKAYPIDVNPRITSTIALTYAGGVNLPGMQVRRLFGDVVSGKEVEYGTRVVRRRFPVYYRKDGEVWTI